MPMHLDGCLFCIDGNMPAGTHDILCEVYKPCPICLIVCHVCEGEGVFPADFTCLACLVANLAGLGLAPLLCQRCLGVIDLIPRDTLPEVTCHAHH